jgi:hypothetical protein
VAGHQRGSMTEGGACREWCMGHRGWKMIVGPDAVEVRRGLGAFYRPDH